MALTTARHESTVGTWSSVMSDAWMRRARRPCGGNDSVGCSTVPVPKPLSSLLKNPVVQLLHQLPFTPYTIKHVQQPRTQQLFRRDRRAPCRGIPYAKIVV